MKRNNVQSTCDSIIVNMYFGFREELQIGLFNYFEWIHICWFFFVFKHTSICYNMSERENSKTEETIDRSDVQSSPYDYLNRDFSSENFKIEVKNMPKFYGFNVRFKLHS